MKALIIGLGSMGKRRIRNLLALGYRDIVGYDPREDRIKEVEKSYAVRPCLSITEAFETDPDMVIISTPPNHHLEYALIALNYGKHVFIEASAIDDGLEKLLNRDKDFSLVIAPSCTMRFHPAVKTIKSLIESSEVGRVLAFTHHFGQYLPKWHPYEDYRTFYVSDPLAGATVELVAFELVWLTWILGVPSKVSAFKGKIGSLDNKIDDLYQVIMEFHGACIGHLQVDILQRTGNRSSVFVCSDGNISWDWDEPHVTVKYPDGKSKVILNQYTSNSLEGFYIDEMEAFINATQGKSTWKYSVNDDRINLALLSKIQESAETGRHIDFSID